MKLLLQITLVLTTSIAVAQTAFYNSGNVQVHNNANIGLHTDFINNANFDQTTGTLGFYGNRAIIVSGSIPPSLWDAEIFMDANVFLQTPIMVRNNVNFVDGDVLTPTNLQSVYLSFMNEGLYTGEGDFSKITGFAAINDRNVFIFPVGDPQRLRPLTLNSQGNTPLVICGYFFENPSNPSSVLNTFDTFTKVNDIGTVSDREFWIVQSDVPAQVTISWDDRSNLAAIPNATFESIIVVGWNKSANQWVIIGNSGMSGDINQGFVTSQTFVPSDYAAITFGTIPLPTDTFAVNNPTLGNYFLSPNADGINDVLVIDGLEESPNNVVRIFNRYGQKVFEQVNYTNQFQGIANTGTLVLGQEKGLPEGVYFYTATLFDLELEYTGFLFLDQ
ncbi:gliding motility-associated C-terminal domain-containing protein [Flagellimonas zhangzhouensis]|nr:gliding motility-associated C-terminal domain-containing protein [Allomuricauda zhangzhouensis]